MEHEYPVLEVPTEARHASLTDVVTMLKAQQDVRYDVVVPAAQLAYADGYLRVDGGGVVVDEDGVTEVPVDLRPTAVFESGVADKLGIPGPYLRRMRAEGHLNLLDHNVNEWLQEKPARQFLVRGFRTDDYREVGIARAFLSDRYRPIDNVDVLMAVLGGIKEAGLSDVKVYDGNVTETRMSIRITAPEVNVVADGLLARYRSPFDPDGRRPGAIGNQLGARGHEFHPHTVFAGIILRNSETGGGKYTLAPQAVIKICSNGLTVTKDAIGEVHLGKRLQEGRVEWSDETQRKNLELIVAQTKDAVKTFLSAEYLADVVADVTEKAAKPVEDTIATITRIGKQFGFTEGEQKGILDFFVSSGDLTAGGVMGAVTAVAQVVESPDRQAEIEDLALDVLGAV